MISPAPTFMLLLSSILLDTHKNAESTDLRDILISMKDGWHFPFPGIFWNVWLAMSLVSIVYLSKYSLINSLSFLLLRSYFVKILITSSRPHTQRVMGFIYLKEKFTDLCTQLRRRLWYVLLSVIIGHNCWSICCAHVQRNTLTHSPLILTCLLSRPPSTAPLGHNSAW